MLFEEAVAQLQGAEAGGFDVSPTQAGKLVNEGIRRFAAASLWVQGLVELGPTSAGQAAYPIPDNVVEIDLISIAGAPYDKKGIRTLAEVKVGLRALLGSGGIFAQSFNSDGSQKQFEIYPVPDDGGAPIEGLAAILPDDLVAGQALPFPEDKCRSVIDAAKAVAYEDVDENPQMADYYSGKVETAAEELRRRSIARTQTGPVQIQITR